MHVWSAHIKSEPDALQEQNTPLDVAIANGHEHVARHYMDLSMNKKQAIEQEIENARWDEVRQTVHKLSFGNATA